MRNRNGRTNKKFFFAVVVLAALLFSFLQLPAQEGAKPGVEEKDRDVVKHLRRALYMAKKDLYDGRLLLKFREDIGLSENQVKKIENMVLDYEEACIKRGAEIKILELQFATYVKSDHVDRKQIENLIREISKKKTDGIINYMNYLLDLKEILTPAQLQKIRASRDKWPLPTHEEEEDED